MNYKELRVEFKKHILYNYDEYYYANSEKYLNSICAVY